MVPPTCAIGCEAVAFRGDYDLNVRYSRAPSAQFQELLLPGGFLAPLLEPRSAAGVRLDMHFRVDDHLHVYCGLTRIIDAKLKGTEAVLSAHRTYKAQDCARPLLRRWKMGQPGFPEAIATYTARVEVAPKYTRKEGAIQSVWHQFQEPWIPFDREAEIGYVSKKAQTSGRASRSVNEALEELIKVADYNRWACPKKGHVPAKVDQLAIDPEGRLVLIELKDTSASPDTVYYSLLQLLHYVHEWHRVLDTLLPSLQRVIDARVELGITPNPSQRLKAVIRPVIGFGADTRSCEVKRRYAKVLDVVNAYLPDGVGQIETWALEQGKPRQVES